MEKRTFNTVDERLDFLDFRQQLLFDNDDVSRILFEYQITKQEYTEIMNLMEKMRERIIDKQTVSHSAFEQRIYAIVPSCKGDYHFCKFIAKAFMDEGRWEEVFPALYVD